MRGRHGGVRLAKPASDIRIGHVVRAMESMAIEIEGDGAAKPSESKERAAGINQILDNALEAFISVLDQHTLLEMALGKKPGALGTGGGKPRRGQGDQQPEGGARQRSPQAPKPELHRASAKAVV